jgi:hypothetical protein
MQLCGKCVFQLQLVSIPRANRKAVSILRAFANPLWLAAMTLVVCTAWVGCGDKPSAPRLDRLEQYAQEHCSEIGGDFASQCDKSGDQKVTRDLNIYIDGSLSMAGFAQAQGSIFRELINGLLQQANANRFNLNIYKFSTKVENVTGKTISEIQSPAFYDGGDTPLAQLIETIAAEPNDRTSIVISDMVQSQKGRDSQWLARAFSGLASKRPEIELLGYRSDFDGDYYPEMRLPGSPGRFPLKMSQTVPGNGRPFYLLVIAPNAATMETVRKTVLNTIPYTEMYDPNQPPVRITAITDDAAGASSASWRLASSFHEDRLSQPPLLVKNFRWSGAEASGEALLPLKVDFRSSSTLAWHPESGVDLRAKELSWDGKDFTVQAKVDDLSGSVIKAPVQVSTPAGKDAGKTDMRLELLLRMASPPNNVWEVYLVSVRPGEGSLSPPPWVDEWDTEDDNAPLNGNRTFQLKLITECMMNSITEKLVIGEWVLGVKRGGS